MPDAFGFRRKGEPFEVKSISADDHDRLRAAGAVDHTYWETKGEDVGFVASFRNEAKEHYFLWQQGMCCYCSQELDDHQRTYDAEHIMDKFNFSHFMFDPRNLAASCVTCNNRKKNKSVLVAAEVPVDVPGTSDDYTIVHPHHDEWGHYFKFDLFRRVTPLAEHPKALWTIEMCGIRKKNALRLAMYFHPSQIRDVEKVVETITDPDVPLQKKLQQHALLGKLAVHHMPSKALLEFLEEDLREHLQAAEAQV